MRFIRTAKVGTDPLRQLASGQQAVMLDHVALGMHPFGFNGIEPGTLRRQQKRQNPHALASLLDLLIVLADPGANRLTLMPGGIIPDQKPVRLASLLQALTTPVQELGGDGALRVSAGPRKQAVRRVFFCWYCGSGLVIQCLARFQLVFKRLSARRTLSSEMGVVMMPCSKLTWAANSRVHTPRSLPKSRGLRCSSSLRRTSTSCETLVCS